MSLLSPYSLGWLALLAPLVLLYVLRRQRTQRVIGSTLLWARAVRDMRAERPWQKLVPYLSLLLQALVLILGALALARPSGVGELPSGARISVVIDASASMATVDLGDASRIDRARAAVRTLAEGLPVGGALSIIEAGAEPVVLLASSSDRVQIEDALAQLRVRGAESSIEAAVALAAERLHDAPTGSRIVILTDAASDDEASLIANVPVEIQRVTGAGENDGIVALDIRARPTEESPDRAEIFVRIARFALAPASRWVTASIEGRGIVASRRVELTPGESESVLMLADLPPDAEGRAAVVRVELHDAESGAANDHRDALALDDIAVAGSPGARRLPVFLVGNAPASVRRVLLADADVELFQMSLEVLTARMNDPAQSELDGLFVFAGGTPDLPPPGNAIVVAPTGPSVFGIPLGEPVENARVVSWQEADARLRFVPFADVLVRAQRPVPTGSAESLVQTDQGTLIASITRPDGQVTLLSFDPDASNFPDQAGFVVFFRNILDAARSARAEGGIAAGRIGESLRVPAPDGSTVEVLSPDGSTARGLSRGGVAIVDVAAWPGAFEVRSGRRRLFALRNLLSPTESNPSARARYTSGTGGDAIGMQEAAAPREAWAWLACALLVVLTLEALWGTRKGAT